MTSLPSAKAYRTRLSAVFASAAPRAVILRRGPRTHWHLINWDLETDTFTHGQWMKGVLQLCDLSPDGEKLIYLAAQYHQRKAVRAEASGPYEPLKKQIPNKLRKGRKLPGYMQQPGYLQHSARKASVLQDTWTAVSTPPYFTALALWPAFGRWTGGGFFHSKNAIFIGEPEDRMTPINRVPFPSGMRVQSFIGIERNELNRLVAGCASHGHVMAHDHLQIALTASGAGRVDFIHARSDRELLFSCDGCLYRQRDWTLMPPERLLGEASKVADFRDCRFELMAAPQSAMLW